VIGTESAGLRTQPSLGTCPIHLGKGWDGGPDCPAHGVPLNDEIRTATNGNFMLGSGRFKEEVARMLDRRVIPGQSGRPRRGGAEG
jgi:hypothetical protein